MGIRGFFKKHIGNQADYTPRRSLVNKVRDNGMSRPMVGAGVGAAIGTVGGFAYGLSELSKDTVTVTDVSERLLNPRVVGADFDHGWTEFQTYTDADGNMQTRMVHHPDDWDPIVERFDTGETYDRQEFRHSRNFGPVKGALIGGGIGLVAGALIGGLSHLAIPDQGYSWPPKEAPEDKRGLAQTADKTPLLGLGAGLLLGAGAGYAAGTLAAAKNQTVTQTVQVPIYERQVVGHIPYVRDRRNIPKELFHRGDKIYYNELPESFGERPFSDRYAVRRKVFTGDFETVTRTENSHWLTPVKGALIGAGLGAGIGLATGIAAGVLMKAAAGEDPPSAY